MMTQTRILELAIDGATVKLAHINSEIQRGEKIYEEHANLVDGHITRAHVKEVLKDYRAQAEALEKEIDDMRWMKAMIKVEEQAK